MAKKKSDTTKVDATTGEPKDSKKATDFAKLDEEQRAIDMVMDCKKESTDFYEEKFRRFNYFDRLYIKGAAKTNVPYGRANLELPLAFQQVEPFVDQLTELTLREAPFLVYDGRTASDEEAAKAITDFVQYQLETGAFTTAAIRFYRALGKYGTAVMKVIWETEIKTVKEMQDQPNMGMDPMTGQPTITMEQVEIERDIVAYDNPAFHNVCIYDFFVPRSATSCDVQKMSWVIHRAYRDAEELLHNPNYNLNRDKIKECVKKVRDGETDTSYLTTGVSDQPKRTSLEQVNTSDGSTKFDGKVEVLEWWGDYNRTKDGDKEPALLVVALIGNEEVLIRNDENPLKFKFKPFLMSNDYPIEGEAYGYGELDHIKGLVEESTALRNARLDVANISINSPWLVERQAGVNIRHLYTAPNNIIMTNDMNGVKRLEMGQITSSSVQELAKIDFDIQNTTNIVNPRQDVSTVGQGFGSTATGVNFLTSRTNLRIGTKLRVLEETFFKPLARIMTWYNQDMITDEVNYRVSESEQNPWRTLPPDAFYSDVDFKRVSAPEKTTLAERKDNISYLLQTIAGIEKAAPGMNNLYEVMKEVYKVSGFAHPEKYVNPPQTTVLQTVDGRMVDQKGQPVNVVPVDQQGQPLPPPEQSPMLGGGPQQGGPTQ